MFKQLIVVLLIVTPVFRLDAQNPLQQHDSSIVWTGQTDIFYGFSGEDGYPLEIQNWGYGKQLEYSHHPVYIAKIDPHYFDLQKNQLNSALLKMMQYPASIIYNVEGTKKITYDELSRMEDADLPQPEGTVFWTVATDHKFIHYLKGCFITQEWKIDYKGRLWSRILEICPVVAIDTRNRLVRYQNILDTGAHFKKLVRICRIKLDNPFESIYPISNNNVSLLYHLTSYIQLDSTSDTQITKDSLVFQSLFPGNDSLRFMWLNDADPFFLKEDFYPLPRVTKSDPFSTDIVDSSKSSTSDEYYIHRLKFKTSFNERQYKIAQIFYYNELTHSLNSQVLGCGPLVKNIDDLGQLRGLRPLYFLRYLR